MNNLDLHFTYCSKSQWMAIMPVPTCCELYAHNYTCIPIFLGRRGTPDPTGQLVIIIWSNCILCQQVHDYQGTDWVGSFDLTFDLDEFKSVTMESVMNIEGQNKHLSLGVHVRRSHCLDLYVYAPYWIVNKTALPIQLRVGYLRNILKTNCFCFFHQNIWFCEN